MSLMLAEKFLQNKRLMPRCPAAGVSLPTILKPDRVKFSTKFILCTFAPSAIVTGKLLR